MTSDVPASRTLPFSRVTTGSCVHCMQCLLIETYRKKANAKKIVSLITRYYFVVLNSLHFPSGTTTCSGLKEAM